MLDGMTYLASYSLESARVEAEYAGEALTRYRLS